jgi:hypothetical protein
MTIEKILETLAPAKPMSRTTLYNWLRKLQIKPIGARQNPQQYPDGTPEKILAKLGYDEPHQFNLTIEADGFPRVRHAAANDADPFQ